ncbi:MAG: hypothetical protein NT049_18855 [Planctomycetota bacterium]|nr:hypothetical protein [Planctomycetota bacterium]
MPPTFLHTDSPAWTQWLDSETHYGSFTNCAVRDVLAAVAGPADLKIAPSPALDRTAPHLDLATLTVRQALWKVSSEYGVTVALAPMHEPRSFLGLLETESKRDGPGGTTTMTEVMQGNPARYEKLKAEKKIYREEVQGDTLYYAVQQDRCLPFPNGTSAMIIEVQRYKNPSASP